MTALTIYKEDNASDFLFQSDDFEAIQQKLREYGVRFDRWQTATPISAEMTQEDILSAYQEQIDALKVEGGYVTADVVSMFPTHPDKAVFRAKFLEEHTHGEDEVRFFVNGAGLFCLHLQDEVLAVTCTREDLIGVPAGTRHWFDMGPNPEFTAIRMFNNPEGWVAAFTGDTIAKQFPRFE